MTVKVRPYKRGGWEVDIMLTFPGRHPIRERRKAPVGSKSAARRWGEERERQLIKHYTSTDADDDTSRPEISKKEVPTLAAFIPRFMEGHCKANRLRPSTIHHRTVVLGNHVIPALGHKRLDQITAEDIQRFKAERAHLKNTTVNHQLTLILTILNVAVEWGVIEKVPVRIKKLKEVQDPVKFYDFEEYDRLVLAAEESCDPYRLLLVLLGGEAGFRCGEIRGLRWSDIDMQRETLTVARTIWRKYEGPPKGGRVRTVPLAGRLKKALIRHRELRLRGPHVVTTTLGTTPSGPTLDRWLQCVQEVAGFERKGPHILRHTFCSHLAMRGVPARVIQELAGHQSIRTTERYMHLTPTAVSDAVRLLDRPDDWRHAGDERSGVVQLNDFNELD